MENEGGSDMHALEQMFSCLSLFSDINWSEVTREFETQSTLVTFPEYLQQKSLEGDCPPYLYELAFYEIALLEVKSSSHSIPNKPGIYLNPNTIFLNLEFDIKRMLDEASLGKINVYEKSHILCLHRNLDNELQITEISHEDIEILQKLEDGPLYNLGLFNDLKNLQNLINSGIIINLISP